jgi:hypothetical protein
MACSFFMGASVPVGDGWRASLIVWGSVLERRLQLFLQAKPAWWRGSLLPLGCAAAPFYERFALKREQAPSPRDINRSNEQHRRRGGFFPPAPDSVKREKSRFGHKKI